MRTSIPAALLVAAAGTSAGAADPCAGVDTHLTAERKQAYAPLVAGSVTGKVSPSEVVIEDFLRLDDWIVVGAEVPSADGEGFFFFQKTGDKLRLHDVWGGYADPSEAGEIADWARGLGAPAGLATCFANAAID
jgi:hypothetical protein